MSVAAAAPPPRRRRLPWRAWLRLGFWWLCKSMSRVAAVVLWDCRIFGARNLPRAGNFVIAPNHRSFLDPWFVGAAVPGVVSFLARDTLFRVPLFGRLIRVLNSVPLARETASARQGLEVAIAAVREGRTLILFPEGTRSIDGNLQPLKRGIALVASQGARPVVPMWVEGSFDVWPKGRRLPATGKISVHVGRPILADGRLLPALPAPASAEEKSAGDLARLVEDGWLRIAARGPGESPAGEEAPSDFPATAPPAPAVEREKAREPVAPTREPGARRKSSASFLEALESAYRALESEAKEWRRFRDRQP